MATIPVPGLLNLKSFRSTSKRNVQSPVLTIKLRRHEWECCCFDLCLKSVFDWIAAVFLIWWLHSFIPGQDILNSGVLGLLTNYLFHMFQRLWILKSWIKNCQKAGVHAGYFIYLSILRIGITPWTNVVQKPVSEVLSFTVSFGLNYYLKAWLRLFDLTAVTMQSLGPIIIWLQSQFMRASIRQSPVVRTAVSPFEWKQALSIERHNGAMQNSCCMSHIK